MTEHRAIRASYDHEYITVYQAYNREIAEAAVQFQNLSASPSYRTRMTWIKPSFCWMMYRCGYSYKDANQEHVLALRIKHANFEALLRQACLATKAHEPGQTVVVQWDPERGPRLEKLDYRSLQMGVPPALQQQWINECIESIENVTEIARELKEKLDREPKVGTAELVEAGLLPRERTYAVSEDVRQSLGMD